MNRGQNIITLIIIQYVVVLSYFLVKFLIRPVVIEATNFKFLKIFVLSYPNFCEAIAGTIMITLILLFLKAFLFNRAKKNIIADRNIYIASILIAGVYVILQELKIHNLGGDNVYDIYDVVFSILGLISVWFILIRINPKIIEDK